PGAAEGTHDEEISVGFRDGVDDGLDVRALLRLLGKNRHLNAVPCKGGRDRCAVAASARALFLGSIDGQHHGVPRLLQEGQGVEGSTGRFLAAVPGDECLLERSAPAGISAWHEENWPTAVEKKRFDICGGNAVRVVLKRDHEIGATGAVYAGNSGVA